MLALSVSAPPHRVLVVSLGQRVSGRSGLSLLGTPEGRSERMWVDELVPPAAGADLLFDALGRLPLTDDGQVVTLGPADLATRSRPVRRPLTAAVPVRRRG